MSSFDYDSHMWQIFEEGERIAGRMRGAQRLVLALLQRIVDYRNAGDGRDLTTLNNRLLAAERLLEALRSEFLEHVRALRTYEHILS